MSNNGLRLLAPAKVNLALHVTGQRPDGYHTLSSLVVFAGVGDRITLTPARDFALRVEGPRAAGVPTDDSNLVLRAARALAGARGVRGGVAMTLTKILPHGGGIGGGSSDAATVLRGLARLWDVAPADQALALSLGADVPVCCAAPVPQVMTGIGETLTPCPPLPSGWLVLAHPGVVLNTGAVFRAMAGRFGPALPEVPGGLGFDDFAAWVRDQRNDMAAAAEALAPEIARLRAEMEAQTGCALARMSGSGSTVFGLFATRRAAEDAAAELSGPQRWVTAAPILGADAAMAL